MNTFSKEERLCSKKLIGFLLQNGSSFLSYPLRFQYKIVDNQDEVDFKFPAQVLISVSKRKFKRANKRNRLKRLMREAYRLNKQDYFYNDIAKVNKKIILMISFIGNELVDFNLIDKKVKSALSKISQSV